MWNEFANRCLIRTPERLRFSGLVFVLILASRCIIDSDDRVMFRMYHEHHEDIVAGVEDTPIPPAYIAALMSLESVPPGNATSTRYEPRVYERLAELKEQGRPFGGIERRSLDRYNHRQLQKLATSYGIVQIMGYHCLELGCTITDLMGSYRFEWAAYYIMQHYGDHVERGDWASCFRIHNTGRANGRTTRADYAERGIARMRFYREWERREGNLFTAEADLRRPEN